MNCLNSPNAESIKRLAARRAPAHIECLRIWLLGCLVFLPGCGPSQPDTFETIGEVYYNGQPVEGATVVFSSDGPPAKGVTDAQGRFSLRTFSDGDGTIAGQHSVTITKNVSEASTAEDPYPAVKNMLPDRYARPDSSQLTAEVRAEHKNMFRFDLKD